MFNNKQKILILGVYPPPYGGISVHIKQLLEHLDLKNVDYNLFAANKVLPSQKICYFSSPLIKMWEIFKAKANLVLDYDTNYKIGYVRGWFFKVLLHSFAIKISGKKWVLVNFDGTFPDRINQFSYLGKQILRFLLNKVEIIISANDAITKTLISVGYPANRIKKVLPFLPPLEKNIKPAVPKDLGKFMAEKRPILTATAYAYQRFYNIEILAQAMKRLIVTYPELGLILLMSDKIVDAQYQKEVQNLINDAVLQEKIFIARNIDEVHSILKGSSAFIRTALIDGDSVSVREALYFGVPTIATDTGFRPEGTILYKGGESNDLFEKVSQVLSNPSKIPSKNKVRQEAESSLINILEVLS